MQRVNIVILSLRRTVRLAIKALVVLHIERHSTFPALETSFMPNLQQLIKHFIDYKIH